MVSPELLQEFALFAGLDSDFVQEVAANAEEVAYQKGTWLFYEDNPADALYLIVKGDVELRVSLDKEKQTYANLNTLGEKETLGWSAIVQPHVYRLGAVTASNTQLIKINGEQLRTLMKEQPEQGFLMMQEIVQTMTLRLQAVRNRVPELSFGLIVSRTLTGLAFITGLLVMLLGTGAIVSGDAATIFLALICLIIPIGFVVLARATYPITE